MTKTIRGNRVTEDCFLLIAGKQLSFPCRIFEVDGTFSGIYLTIFKDLGCNHYIVRAARSPRIPSFLLNGVL